MERTKKQIKSSQKNIKDNYPLPIYNYRVDIGEDTMSFTEVSGLNIEYETLDYRHGLTCKEGFEMATGRRKPANITLNRGIINNGNKSVLSDWFGTINLSYVEKKNIYVHLCDEEGVPVITWTVINAFPNNMITPDFNVEDSNVAIEKLELTAADIKIQYHS